MIREHCHLSVTVEEIIQGVTGRMEALYDRHLPVLPGALEAVNELVNAYPLGLASSSPSLLIEYVLTRAGIRTCFAALVSADEVGRGKPAPDVFLATAEKLGTAPRETVVFEDSSAGIQAAHAAGMRVVAVPNPHYPPSEAALRLANLVLPSLIDFRAEMMESL
jgi:HAD superfamily hydrolase (TIGR01509 family)